MIFETVQQVIKFIFYLIIGFTVGFILGLAIGVSGLTPLLEVMPFLMWVIISLIPLSVLTLIGYFFFKKEKIEMIKQ